MPIFNIKKESSSGRLGEIITKHGIIQTPAFIFCGTKAAVKASSPEVLRRTNTQIILSNTYHLLVYPGSKLIHELGGLQKLTNWNGPMMTDSGGYQIFSLGYGSVSQELKGVRNTKKTMVKLNEHGAQFISYRNGEKITLTPEDAMQAQINFGADLIYCLDECTAFHIPKEKTKESMERSCRWAKRSVDYFNQNKKSYQGLYSIIQGGVYEDLRTKCIQYINNLDTFGIAVGGSLGESVDDMEKVLKIVKNHIRNDKPKHLLGIGTIDAILMAIPYGIDTFDCVYPTRLARHGGALVFPNQKKRYINLNNAIYAKDLSKIDDLCECHTCKSYSRAYLHLLLKNNEILGQTAITEHNIWIMNKFMELARKAIYNDSWNEFNKEWNLNKKNF